MRKKKIIYLAPDIDISKNEGGKAHVLGEVKYFQNYFDKVFLVSKNKNDIKLGDAYKNVVFFKIPSWLHHPVSRLLLEPLFFFFMTLFLRIKGYKYLLERSYRLGGWFSIFFCSFGGHAIYEMIEPVYYESYIMPLQNFIIKLMGLFKDIKFLGTYDTFQYNLPKDKYMNCWTGADLELIGDTTSKKHYDVLYIGSVAKRHSLDSIISIIKNNPKWTFLFITSHRDINLVNKKTELKLNNLTIMENIQNAEIYSYIKQCKIGLALYEKNNDLLKNFDYFYSPIKVHEYKGCGLPVIASNIGTLRELVAKSGILVDNSENEILKAIKTLLSNDKQYDELSKNAVREVKEKYNWDMICKYFYNILIS